MVGAGCHRPDDMTSPVTGFFEQQSSLLRVTFMSYRLNRNEFIFINRSPDALFRRYFAPAYFRVLRFPPLGNGFVTDGAVCC